MEASILFLIRSRAVISIINDPIWPKFKLMQDIIHVLVTSNFNKDQINSNPKNVFELLNGSKQSVVGTG